MVLWQRPCRHFYAGLRPLDRNLSASKIKLDDSIHICARNQLIDRHTFDIVSTAWDSEIESLTSLIKLHQKQRHSAPCGQVGAATQPPILVPSPTFELHERSKLDELAHAVMIARFLVVVAFTTSSFQSFLCFIGGIEKQ